jgi:hypothetical protein
MHVPHVRFRARRTHEAHTACLARGSQASGIAKGTSLRSPYGGVKFVSDGSGGEREFIGRKGVDVLS